MAGCNNTTLEKNISKLITQLYKILGIEVDEDFQPIIEVKKKKSNVLPTLFGICVIALISIVAYSYINKKEVSQKINQEVTSLVEKQIPIVPKTKPLEPVAKKIDSIIEKEKKLVENVKAIKEPTAVPQLDNSLLNMAILNYAGTGGNLDFIKAAELFKEADKYDNPLTKMWVALLHLNGQCNFEKSFVTASAIAKPVASEVEKIANEENDNAAYLMGIAYQKGLGVEKNDEKAVEWLNKSADKNNPLALHSLGLMYADGQIVNKDDKKAVELLQKAAEKCNVFSMYYMGLMLKTGRGIEKDDKQSAAWFKKAAQKGHSKSMYVLGSLYEKGIGIQKDHLEALNWWKKAAQKGNKNAQSQLKAWNQTW